MDSRALYTAPSAERRLAWARAWVCGQLSRGEILLLATRRSAADDFVRTLKLAEVGYLGLHRFSLTQLAATLAAGVLAERRFTSLSSLGGLALAARVVQKVLEAGRLHYFQPVAGLPGFPRALYRTLEELRLHGVEAVAVAKTGLPGKDLAVLLEAFQEELQEQSLADLGLVYQAAVEALHRGTAYWCKNRLFLLDVSPVGQLQLEFLRELVQGAEAAAGTALPQDRLALRALESILKVSPQQQAEEEKTGLQRIRQLLFSTSSFAPQEGDQTFQVVSAAGEGQECVEIARAIQLEAASGIPFDRMAVLLRAPETYQSQLEEAFERAGVQAYYSRGSTRPDPAGRAFLSLLRCAQEGSSASRFAEYLSLAQVPELKPECPSPVSSIPWVVPADSEQLVFKTVQAAASRPTAVQQETHESAVVAGTLQTPQSWERLLVDAAVIGGHRRWKRRLEGLEAEFHIRLQALTEEDWQRPHLELQLSRLKTLQSFALPLIRFLSDLPAVAHWDRWLTLLRELASRSLRRPETVLAVLADLFPMRGVGPVGLTEVYGVLEERLSFLRIEPPESRYGRVFVSTLPEIAGMAFDVVFVPGLAEGIFPRKMLEDPLLLDEYRSQLKESLPLLSDQVEQERLLLIRAASAARLRLVASYPRMDVVAGRARVPSLYALEVVRAARGRLPELAVFEREAAGGARSRLGWPAPHDPNLAIDEAEFDLAVLDPLFQETRQGEVGGGRYLLEINENLARSLRTRYKRWQPAWADDDGVVAAKRPSVLKALKPHRLTQRSYSPTALQAFATCPYRFFLYAIQRLRPREEIVALERMDPLIRGSLFHQVQFLLFKTLKSRDMLPLLPEMLGATLNLADEALDKVANDFFEQLAPALPRVWESEVEEIRLDVRSWLRQVVATDREWEPIHFEFSFGLPLGGDHDEGSLVREAQVPGGRLRGSIDLVERHRRRGLLRVTDHKTGAAPRPAPKLVGGGEILQPLLYGLAAEDILGAPVSGGRLFYCTQRGSFQQIWIELREDSRRQIKQLLRSIDESIAKGFLPAAPRERACHYCDFRLICGPYEELRVERKQKGPLQSLLRIRQLP